MSEVLIPKILLLSERGDPTNLMRDLGRLGPCEIISPRNLESASVSPRLVITSVEMTDLAAFVRLRHALQGHGELQAPLVCLVADLSQQAMARANSLGAREVLPLSLPRPTLMDRLSSILSGDPASTSRIVDRAVRSADVSLSSMMSAAASGRSEIARHLELGASAILSGIEQADIAKWLALVWKHDDTTHQHCLLVAGLAAAFSVRLGFNGSDRRKLTRAALLHDIGKAKIPLEILNKPGKFTAQELVVMRSHAALGHGILVQHGKFDAEELSVVRHHHEYLDGSGYPDGLLGAKISDLVRLTTICDIYAALIERRPYREPLSPKVAFAELSAMEGKLDRALVRAFRDVAFASGEAKAAAA